MYFLKNIFTFTFDQTGRPIKSVFLKYYPMTLLNLINSFDNNIQFELLDVGYNQVF